MFLPVKVKAITWIRLGFPGDSVVKNLPAKVGDTDSKLETPGREDPLEEEMATHPSILARKIP